MVCKPRAAVPSRRHRGSKFSQQPFSVRLFGCSVLHDPPRSPQVEQDRCSRSRSKSRCLFIHTNVSSTFLASSPRVQCLIIAYSTIVTPLTYQTPRPRSYDTFDHPLVPYQARQRLRPRFTWVVPCTVRIQPLVHDPLSRLQILRLPRHDIRIVGIG
jgi:hypothetical protein